MTSYLNLHGCFTLIPSLKSFAISSFFPVFAAVFLLGFFYRLWLYLTLYTSVVPFFSFSPADFPLFVLISYGGYELLFAALVSAVFLIFHRLNRILLEPFSFRTITRTEKIADGFLLFFIAVVYGTHFRLIFSMHMGLQYETLVEFLQSFSITYYARFISLKDAVFLSSPMIVYFLIRRAHPEKKLIAARVVAIMAGIPLFFLLLSVFIPRPQLAAELRQNPFFFAGADVIRTMLRPELKKEGFSGEQKRSVRFVDPLFMDSSAVKANLPNMPKKDWNIVFIILESTGFQYVFDESYGNEMPMPFLRKLADESLFLENHMANANSSPRAVFSLLSGIYPSPEIPFFSMKKNLRIPSARSFLPRYYESFITTPSNLTWYFPRGFFENSGVSEFYGFTNLPLPELREGWKLGRHEEDVADSFLWRVDRAVKPFLGIYITFAPHWPYFEFEQGIDVFRGTKSAVHPWMRRYYNNLRLQDNMLKKVFSHLEKKDLLKKTIFVIIGDHSEAFGQHPGNWTHGRASYQENIHVPALLYQPALFKPYREKRVTTHADMLPTLLDAMNINYETDLFQGESLFREKFQRRYVFMYGNENTVNSISGRKKKMQYLVREQICRVFDLRSDPVERKPGGCSGEKNQRKALLKFLELQPKILENYNASLLMGGKFSGKRHPVLFY